MSIWRGLEQAAANTSQMLSAYLMNEYQRGREAERQKIAFEQRADYTDNINDQNRADAEQFKMDMQEQGQKWTADHDKWKIDYQALVNQYGGNVEFKEWIEERVGYDDPEISGPAKEAYTAWNSLKNLQPLTEGQQAVVSELPLSIQGTITSLDASLREKLEDREMQTQQLEDMHAYREAATANIEALTANRGKLTAPELMRIKASAGASLASLMMNPNFTQMNMMRMQSKDGKLPTEMEKQFRIFMSAAGGLESVGKLADMQLQDLGVLGLDKVGGEQQQPPPVPPPSGGAMYSAFQQGGIPVFPEVKEKHEVSKEKEVYDSTTYTMILAEGGGERGDLVYDDAQDMMLVNLGGGVLVDVDKLASSEQIRSMMPAGVLENLIKEIKTVPKLGQKALDALNDLGAWLVKKF